MILVQILFAFLLFGPIISGTRNWFKYKEYSTPKGTSNYNTMINSAVLYAIAFNLIFFIQELFLVLGKKAIGLKSVLYHNNHTFEGEHPLASLMQGSGALAIFLVGLICLAIFRSIPYSKSTWKLFVLWLAFHGLIQSIPQVLLAPIAPNTDVGEALVRYLGFSETILITLSIISAVAQVLICIWFSKPLLEFAPIDVDLYNPKVKLRYIQFIAVGSAFIGSIMIIPFRVLPISQAITPFIVFIFSIPWLWSAAASSKPFGENPNSLDDKIDWIPIICLVILLLFFQLVLAPGVAF